MPIVTALRSTHPAVPDPAPAGADPSGAPATHITLITGYGVSASAAPYAAHRPARSQKSTRGSLRSSGIPASDGALPDASTP
ncbi:hypothetical protein [Streptomyces albiaxialis]